MFVSESVGACVCARACLRHSDGYGWRENKEERGDGEGGRKRDIWMKREGAWEEREAPTIVHYQCNFVLLPSMNVPKLEIWEDTIEEPRM